MTSGSLCILTNSSRTGNRPHESIKSIKFASRPTRRHLANLLDITTSSPNSQPEPQWHSDSCGPAFNPLKAQKNISRTSRSSLPLNYSSSTDQPCTTGRWSPFWAPTTGTPGRQGRTLRACRLDPLRTSRSPLRTSAVPFWDIPDSCPTKARVLVYLSSFASV